MYDFEELKDSLLTCTLLARGGQKVVYSAMHEIYGSVVLKLFHEAGERSQR